MLDSASHSLEIQKRLGKASEALPEFREAVDFASRVQASNRATFYSYRQLVGRLEILADLLVQCGRSGEAVELYDRMVNLTTPWEKSDQHRHMIIPWLANSLAASAKIYSETGRAAEGVRRIERAIQISAEQYRPRLTLDMAKYLRIAGDVEGARAAAVRASKSPELAAEARQFLAEVGSTAPKTALRP
jgi:tetratricopeptide (TPR) repeat protein